MEGPHNAPGIAMSAPYGRACMNCSRAKVRCMYRRDGVSCERCHRLQRECQVPDPVRKRNVRKPESRAHLEEKLDDLVSLLRAQATARPSTAVQDAGEPAAVPANSFLSPPATTATALQSTAASSPISTSQLGSQISVEEAEECLDTFRTVMLRFFPFVQICTTAEQLRRDRPFLWLSIMAITVKSTSQQVTVSEQIRQEVCQRMIMGSERSIDLLLGMLCFIAWSHYHKRDRPYLGVWTHLALSLVFDLGLNRPTAGESALCARTAWGTSVKVPQRQRTMEECRAVLSVFLLSSTICVMLRKADALRWTPHMDECLRQLSERCEWHGDMVLAVQVRCHLIVEQIAHSPWELGPSGENMMAPDAEPTNLPPAAYVKALQAELQDIQRSLPPEALQDATVQLFLHGTDLTIHDSSLYHRPTGPAGTTDFEALDGLHATLRTITAWLSACESLPPLAILGFTYPIFSQLSHCAVNLFRLTTLRDPAWDRAAVRRKVDVFDLIDSFADRFESLPALAGLVVDREEENIFPKHAKMMRAMRASMEADLAAAEALAGQADEGLGPGRGPSRAETAVDGEGNVAAAAVAGGAATEDLAVAFVDDQWLADIFGPWDSGL